MFCLNFLIYNINLKKSFKKHLIKNNKILFISDCAVIFKKNILNKKYIGFLFNYNKNYYFYYNNINKKQQILFFNSISLFIENNFNFLFLSNQSELLIPYYSSIFSNSDIFNYRNFIFYKPEYFNFNNWFFLFNCFLKKFSIKILLILVEKDYQKYIKSYNKINLIKMRIIFNTPVNPNADFYFFANQADLFFFNVFTMNYFIILFFKNLNLNFYKFKFLYYLKLKQIIEKHKLLN